MINKQGGIHVHLEIFLKITKINKKIVKYSINVKIFREKMALFSHKLHKCRCT